MHEGFGFKRVSNDSKLFEMANPFRAILYRNTNPTW